MRYSSILLLGAGAIVSAGVAPPRPLITPGPSHEELQLKELELRIRRDASNINLGSLADVLATGVPPSILALALTNMPAVSKLLWSEFLDSNTPSWFTALPTDIQGYLSGEFGPTTTAASSTTASSASASASSTSSVPSVSATSVTTEASKKPYGTGLPTWAKVLIGVAVPIFVLGLFALVILCLVRRRRRRRLHKAGAESRAPTPAFISNSHRPREDNFGNHSEIVALNDPARHSAPITRKPVPQPTRIDRNSSSSEEYTTPPTHSFEDIPPPPVFGAQHSARNSRQSFSSLHSVPEVPEPGAAHFGAGVAPPPRSPRRSSREFNKEFGQGTKQPMPPLNPATNANYVRAQHRDVDSYIASQGLYAGGHNPYPRQNDKYEDYRHENPFSDPSPPRESGNMASGGYRGVDYDEEMYSPPPRNHGHNWPLHGGQDEEDRTFSFERGDDPGYPYKRH